MPFWSLLAVGAGIASGLLYFGASFGTPLGLLLSNVALLPLFLAGLGIGAIGAGIAALAGAIVVGSQFGFYGGGTYLAFHGLPVLILCRQALLSRTTPDNQVVWYPGGRLLACLAGITATYYLIILAYFSIARDGLITAIQGELKEFIVALGNIIPAQNAETILQAAPIVPSISAAYFMLNVVINGALAQLILARSGRNLRPSIGFSKIALPSNLLYLLAACAVVTFISSALGPIALTLAFILVVAYFLLGLAVVHAYLSQRPNHGMALFSFYVIFILLLILFLPLGLAIVGLGIIEQAIGLRRRFAAPGAGEEEE